MYWTMKSHVGQTAVRRDKVQTDRFQAYRKREHQDEEEGLDLVRQVYFRYKNSNQNFCLEGTLLYRPCLSVDPVYLHLVWTLYLDLVYILTLSAWALSVGTLCAYSSVCLWTLYVCMDLGCV